MLAYWLLALAACSEPLTASPAAGTTPTAVTRAARTAAARPTPTAILRIPTAVVYLDPASGRPVWPTATTSCRVSPVGRERPDLGPTVGEPPVWMASTVLPVIPWRNEFIRSVWIVDRSAEGDLMLTGRRVDGDGSVRFVRVGGERATEQLRIASAATAGAAPASSTAGRYTDHQVYLVVPSPGCWEFTATVGDHQQTLTVQVYN